MLCGSWCALEASVHSRDHPASYAVIDAAVLLIIHPAAALPGRRRCSTAATCCWRCGWTTCCPRRTGRPAASSTSWTPHTGCLGGAGATARRQPATRWMPPKPPPWLSPRRQPQLAMPAAPEWVHLVRLRSPRTTRADRPAGLTPGMDVQPMMTWRPRSWRCSACAGERDMQPARSMHRLGWFWLRCAVAHACQSSS